MRVLIAPDKFKGTATAREVADAVAVAVESCGSVPVIQALADGGEGTLEALGGANRTLTVAGPLGEPVEARWRLGKGRTAVVEMAEAAGLELAGGAEGNDPLAADTSGVGELIDAAVQRGARHIIVGVGGSATTDGGWGAVRALYPVQRLRGVDLVVACDVRTTFVEAAEVFGPQKGASPAQVELLRRRLLRLVQVYEAERGVDVSQIPGAGAAGGLAGGLASVGAKLVDGFDVVSDAVQLYDQIEAADLVVTGEGTVDTTSFDGKVVGGVCELAADAGVPVVVIAGAVEAGVTC
ncbi:MAG: glycerate kinase, partial [Acidimicrobiales bacterium]